MLLQQPVDTANYEVHHLVGRVYHAEAVGGAWVVRLVKVLVDGFKELLFLGVVGDLVGSTPNRAVVGS